MSQVRVYRLSIGERQLLSRLRQAARELQEASGHAISKNCEQLQQQPLQLCEPAERLWLSSFVTLANPTQDRFLPKECRTHGVNRVRIESLGEEGLEGRAYGLLGFFLLGGRVLSRGTAASTGEDGKNPAAAFSRSSKSILTNGLCKKTNITCFMGTWFVCWSTSAIGRQSSSGGQRPGPRHAALLL